MSGRDLIELLEAESGTENPAVWGTVDERLAGLSNYAGRFRRMPQLLFEQAVTALRDCGLRIAEAKVQAVTRHGDTEALREIANRALAFSRKTADQGRPTDGPAADLLCALAAYVVTDREKAPPTPEAYEAWMSRRDAALYTLAAAEVLFSRANLGIFSAAGERLSIRSKQRAGGKTRVKQRQDAAEPYRKRAIADFSVERSRDQKLTVHHWAYKNAHKEKYGGKSDRALTRWLRAAKV
ncbi:MAG: hypothetical protein JNJ73_10735 [Hyphomonadaceae bacterium]|nr:hypothetical protein [Hyphomonadaceae bacterium]